LNAGCDFRLHTVELVRRLREHGIATIGSTIIELPHHTTDGFWEEIEHAISHKTDFHQFMDRRTEHAHRATELDDVTNLLHNL
jgi:radical SAM superfamily enzyme